ncbi:MAG: YdjY domain-containing protein [Planctomycetota bacterium]
MKLVLPPRLIAVFFVAPILAASGCRTAGLTATEKTDLPRKADITTAAAAKPEPSPKTAQAPVAPREVFPGITLDLENRHIDVDATVVGREVEWLELLACRPNTREYEAIVSVDGEAASIGVALSLLGLEAGQPARTEKNAEGQRLFFAPHGPLLELFFVLDDQPDAPIPANEWVVDQETGATMAGNTWLFTGSTVIEFQGNAFFMAEKNGTVVSLLNFGDELVSRPTEKSEAGGTDLWTANTEAIPPVGTRLKLRFRTAEAK